MPLVMDRPEKGAMALDGWFNIKGMLPVGSFAIFKTVLAFGGWSTPPARKMFYYVKIPYKTGNRKHN